MAHCTICESLIVIIFKLFANFVFELATLSLYVQNCQESYKVQARCEKKYVYGSFIKIIIKEGVRAKERSSMPIFEIQLVETKQSSQYDRHIHLRVVCKACKQSHVYTEHTVLYH